MYADWQTARPEYAWNFLENIGIHYHHICRQLRNIYHWAPSVIDEIEITRLFKIFEETKEDNKKEKNEFDDLGMR